MWREAGLRWKDFLPEDEDVNKFVTEKVTSDMWGLPVGRRRAASGRGLSETDAFVALIWRNCVTVTQNVEFTLGEETERSSRKELSSAELSRQLDKLIQDQADNQRIFDWIEVCPHQAPQGEQN